MPHIQLDEIEVYYEIRGTGPRLLFINGSGGDLRQKPNLLDGPLTEHFEVLAYDQRGLGRTSKPQRDYHMHEYGDDAGALLEALGWDRCHVMGVSFGGMVAQEFALRHPHLVDRLVLACTSSGGAGGASYPLHELQTLSPEEQGIRGLELADRRYDADWREQNPEAFESLRKLMAERRSVPGIDEAERDALAVGMQRQLDARRGHDTWDRLPALEAQSFICGGQHDGIAPPENQHALAKQIPNGQLEFFEGGHLFLMQDPKAWVRILEFLRS